jgi:WD40 repeat protein
MLTDARLEKCIFDNAELNNFTSSFTLDLLRHEDAVLSVAFSSDGKYLASGSNDKTIKLFNI